MRVQGLSRGEYAVVHVEPVSVAVGGCVGLYAYECSKVVKEADVEIGDTPVERVEQL